MTDTESDSGKLPKKRSDLWWVCGLILCPLLILGCWRAPFLELDDGLFILDNPVLQADAPWSAVLRKDFDYMYMPLTYATFRVDRWISEFQPKSIDRSAAWATVVRIGNVFFHLAAALLVWWFLRGLNVSAPVAGFVVTAFALHPMVCQSVCWPIQRKTLMAGAFGFAAMGVYIRGDSPKHIAAASVLHALALLSKASAFGLLPILVLWELLGCPVLNGSSGSGVSMRRGFAWRRALIKLAPLVLTLFAAYLNQMDVMRRMSTGPAPLVGGSYWSVALTDVPVLERYLINFLWPFYLSAEYGLPAVTSLLDSNLWICGSVLISFVALTIFLVSSHSRRFLLFAGLAFLAALFPALNFFGKYNLLADSHAYLAAPFFFLVTGLAIEGFVARTRNRVRYPKGSAAFSLGLLSIALAIGAANRSYEFRSAEELYTDCAQKEPKCAVGRMVLANILHKKAEQQFLRGDLAGEKASRLREMEELEACTKGYLFERCRVTEVYLSLARCYYEHGRPEEAAAQIEMARHSWQGMDRNQAALAMRLSGLLAYDKGEYDRSYRYFDGALSLTPDQTFIWIDRTKALLSLAQKLQNAGDISGAQNQIEAARAALLRVPDSDPVLAELKKLLASTN